MIDLQLNVVRDASFGVANRQVAATKSRAFARLDARRANSGRRLVVGDLGQFQAFELFAFGASQRGGAGSGLVAGDEIFEVSPLGENIFVRALLVHAFFLLEFQKGIDLAGKRGQFPPREIERMATGGAEKRPVVRHDQTGAAMTLQKVFEQNLRAQVEKVRRFVEQQEIRLVQQQRRQFHARLPAAGELGDGAFEVGALEFKLPRDFSAFPVGLAAVACQELQNGFAGKKRIVLPQIAEAQARMADDFSAVEFFFAEKNAEQCTFSGPITADEPDLDVVAQGGVSIVEKDLIAVAFAGFCDLEQRRHRECDLGTKTNFSTQPTRRIER